MDSVQALDQIRQLSCGVTQRGVPRVLDIGHDDLNAALPEALLSAPAHAAGIRAGRLLDLGRGRLQVPAASLIPRCYTDYRQ
jgi:hypothetical protein